MATHPPPPIDDAVPLSLQPDWVPPRPEPTPNEAPLPAAPPVQGAADDDRPPPVDLPAPVQEVWEALLAAHAPYPGHNVFREAVRAAGIKASNGRIREWWGALRATVPAPAPPPDDPVTLAEVALVTAQQAAAQWPQMQHDGQAALARCVEALATWERHRLSGDAATLEQKAALLEAHRQADAHLAQVLPALRTQLETAVDAAQATLDAAQTTRGLSAYNAALATLQEQALEYAESLDDLLARHRTVQGLCATLARLGCDLDLFYTPLTAAQLTAYLTRQVATVTQPPARLPSRPPLPPRLQSPPSLVAALARPPHTPPNPLETLAACAPVTPAGLQATRGIGNVWCVRGREHPSLLACQIPRGYETQNAFIAHQPIEVTREEWGRLIATYPDVQQVPAPEVA